MGIEFELKYRATPEILAAVAENVQGQVRRYAMQTVYYDTADGLLSRQFYTLRRRMENEISVCTLKMPTGGAGRAEYSVECPGIREAIPELCKLSGFSEQEQLLAGLQEVCGARFDRTAITVEIPGAVVELALDTGVLTGGGREAPLCELEVELIEGSQEVAVFYGKALALRYGLTSETKSKFRRASALAKGEEHGRI